MAEIAVNQPKVVRPSNGRMKFIIGGVILLAAVAYLVITGISTGQQYYLTIDELKGRQTELTGRGNIRVIGAVIGDTISNDGHTLTFVAVNLPDKTDQITDQGGLATVLHTAVSNPNANRMKIVLYDQPTPELLKNEAQ